ncbi:MAG: diaminopropionate ammonia-lyase [Alphaproteobacteria bacterium]|nr:diaminopropionate ammonia-lyase [Alphaproteobacteria bacterium]
MLETFETASVAYAPGTPQPGRAAYDLITAERFEAARQEITTWSGYAPTPLVELSALASRLSVASIIYKDEGPRFGLGSFKALGGAYAVLKVLHHEIEKAAGHAVPMADACNGKYADIAGQTTVISATDGNHGRSVAWGAQRFGMPCRIYIHAEVSEERAIAMRALGANVTRIDGDYDASVALTRKEGEENGWFIVSDTSWSGYTETPSEVMAGYGVMTHEINQELNRAPTHVFLQGGVGGLAASVTAALKQHWGDDSSRVVVVEPELAPCLLMSAKAGEATVAVIEEETLMAGLSCGAPSKLAWAILEQEASDFLTIPEGVVGPAVRLMARPLEGDQPLDTGESAIAGLAGFICAAMQEELRKKIGLDENSRVLLIGSEGVTDRSLFDKLMAAG